MCRKVGRVLTDVTAGLLTQSPLRLRLGERRCVWSLTGSSKRDSSEQRIGGDRTSSCIQGSYIRSMLQSLRPLSNFNQQSKQKQLSSTHREMKLPIALIGHAVAHPGVMQCSAPVLKSLRGGISASCTAHNVFVDLRSCSPTLCRQWPCAQHRDRTEFTFMCLQRTQAVHVHRHLCGCLPTSASTKRDDKLMIKSQ